MEATLGLFSLQPCWTFTHPGVLEVGSHPHARGRAGGGDRGGVGGGMEVPGDQHHVMANVVFQFIRERQVEHVI